MPITALDNRPRELGRLRLGEDLGDRPTALDVWRLTSAHEDLLAAAADLYGGSVDVWRDGFELTTTTAELPVLVPNQDVAGDQWLELWQGSTISRRCDGINLADFVDGKTVPAGACQCDPAARECKPTTHLRLILPELPDLGVWRLVTRSIYAAAELPTTVDLLLRAHGGDLAPATIAIETRRSSGNRPFIVPVLRSSLTIGELTSSSSKPAGVLTAAPGSGFESAPSTVTAASEVPTPPPPAAVAASDPKTDEDAPNGENRTPGPLGPNDPKRAQWDALGRLLRANPPAQLPRDSAELIEVLVELEELMLETHLWAPTVAGVSPLDSAAAKYDLDGWRDNSRTVANVRTFAIRSIMAAGNAFADSRAGRQIITELRVEDAAG